MLWPRGVGQVFSLPRGVARIGVCASARDTANGAGELFAGGDAGWMRTFAGWEAVPAGGGDAGGPRCVLLGTGWMYV